MKSNSHNSISVFGIWWVVSLVPILFVLVFFIYGQWTWGLMDDHYLVSQAIKSNIFSVFTNIPECLKIGRGLRITYDLYTQVFYSIFQNSPKGLYIFHTFFIAVVLYLWGYIAFLFSEEILSFILVPAVALGCKPFYEGFFYLSVQEILGLFFLGIGLIYLIKIFDSKEANTGISKWKSAVIISSFLLIFGAKETFVPLLAVVLAAFLIRAFFMRWYRMIAWIIGALIITIGYAIWLKFFVQKAYTSSYSFSDVPHLIVNIKAWFWEVFMGQMPWLCILLALIWIYRSKKVPMSSKGAWGIVLSLVLYVIYLVIILPWRGMSYMAIPLAVFFAVPVAVIIGPLLRELNNQRQIILACVILVLNVLPASSQLISFSQYNHDTVYLLKWIDNDPYIKAASTAGKHFGCNAAEPATAITDLVNLVNKKDMSTVSYVPQVKDIVTDKDMLFYFYMPSWGNQDLRLLGDMWTPVFFSENWIVFRRNY